MSPRTFARVYAATMGTTPARMVEKIRVEAVRRALEESDLPIKKIGNIGSPRAWLKRAPDISLDSASNGTNTHLT